MSQVRVLFPGTDAAPEWSIFELQVFGPGKESPPVSSAYPKLMELLKNRGIDHLYSDRWLANAVHKEPGDTVLTEREPSVPEYYGLTGPRPTRAHEWIYYRRREGRNPVNSVVLGPRSALVTRRGDAGLCRRVLADRGVEMRETPVGPWVLFDFGPGQWREKYRDDLGLYWAGFGCLFYDKRWASTLVARAEALYSRDKTDRQARLLLEKALEKHPNCKYAADMLISVCRAAGDGEKATHWASRRQAKWEPQIPAEIEFKNGVELLGISLSSRTAETGGELTMKYYWQCPADLPHRRLAVFVHIAGDREKFQDDHILIEEDDVSCQCYAEVFVEVRRVRVPEGLAEGAYHISLGLYERSGSGARVKVEATRLGEKNGYFTPSKTACLAAHMLAVFSPRRTERVRRPAAEMCGPDV